MSLLEKLLGRYRAGKAASAYFNLLTAYEPRFRRFNGRLYEMDTVRAAIDAIARHCAKLDIKIDGAAQPKLQTLLKKRPNEISTWSQFFYRTATILEMQNSVVIVPLFNRSLEVTGLWPVLPSRCRILKDKADEYWIEYEFSDKTKGAVELRRVGILKKFQYEDDLFGENNTALDAVLDLTDIQRQGIQEGVKSAATFRFMARSTNWKDPEDLATEQRNFSVRNMAVDKSGFLLFPNHYDSISAIQSKPYLINAEDQRFVKESVFDYFGVNEAVIQGTAAGQQLDAFFDGKIEPFTIQLEQVLTRMLFTDLEQGYGAKVHVTANRLQYMSTGDKINFIATLSDRGFITINEGRELLNYTPLPEGQGDRIPIRGEYAFVGEGLALEAEEEQAPEEPAGGEENGDQGGSGVSNAADAGDAIPGE